MGNSSDKLSNDQEVQRIQWKHDHMKDLSIVKGKDDKQCLEAKFVIGNVKDYEKWAAELKNNSFNQSDVIFDPVSHSYHQNGMCGSGGVAKVQYEYFPFMLEVEISNRKNKYDEPFHEKELWYLLHSLSQIGSIFHARNKKVGDLCPKNVFLSEDGNISISNQYSWPGAVTNYHKSFHNNEITYIAPEEINQIHIRRPEPTTDIEKSESFSAGLTMLDAALLECSEKIYQRKQISINFEVLNGMKQNLKNVRFYSDTIKFVILNLLEGEPNRRMTLTNLNQWLSPHAQKIINMEPFEPVQNIPDQLLDTVKRNPITHPDLGSQQPSALHRNQQNTSQDQARRQTRMQNQNFNKMPPSFENTARASIQNPRPGSSMQGFIPHQDPSRAMENMPNFQRLHSPQMRPISMMRRDQPIEEQRRDIIRPGDPQYQRISKMIAARQQFSSPPPGGAYRPQSNYFPGQIGSPPPGLQPAFRSVTYNDLGQNRENNPQNVLYSIPSPRGRSPSTNFSPPERTERVEKKPDSQPIITEDAQVGERRQGEDSKQSHYQKYDDLQHRIHEERSNVIDRIEEKIRNSRSNFPSY